MRKLFKKQIILEIFIFMLIAMSIIFFIKPVKVSGKSMNDTLFDGDLLIVSRQAYSLFGSPKNGDIIVFPHINSYGKRLFVKRIIAVEGQRLEIKNSVVKIDGIVQKEEYLNYAFTEGNIDLLIPKGQVFVMGDNRENSSDSRSFGTVDIDDITGKVIFRLLPLSSIGGV